MADDLVIAVKQISQFPLALPEPGSNIVLQNGPG